MKKLLIATAVFPIFLFGQSRFETDIFETSAGKLKISFVGHGTLMFECDNIIIHIDPVMRETDYSTMPKADLVMVTHHHGDHLDVSAIDHIKKDGTKIIMTENSSKTLGNPDDILIMRNGDKTSFFNIDIEAVPAYNIVHKRTGGDVFHPKGEGNGYIFTIGDTRVYVAGDTENTPEMKVLKNINIAFLPMNLPYTMTPEMAADAARAFKPGVLYPYHYGNSDTGELIRLLKDEKEIEVRVLKKK